METPTETRQPVGPGWRVLAFCVVFFLLFLGGQILAAALPRTELAWASLVALLASSVLASWITLRWFDGRPLASVGLGVHAAAPREFGWGFVVGAVLMGAAALLLLLTGSLRFVADAGGPGDFLVVLLWTFVFFGIAAAFEEIVFRGYPFQALVEWAGPWPAILISSALFSWVHGQNPNITALAFGNIFLAGILLALAYLRTRSLWFATSLHLAWNWVMATLLDFPVSGLTGFETPIYSNVVRGPTWWTGAEFGPEGGLVGTLVLLAGIAWLWRSPRFDVAPETTALRPIVDRRLGPGSWP